MYVTLPEHIHAFVQCITENMPRQESCKLLFFYIQIITKMNILK